MKELSQLLTDQGLALFLILCLILSLGYTLPKTARWANKWLERFYDLHSQKIEDLTVSDIRANEKFIKIDYELTHLLNVVNSIDEIQRWQQEKIQDILNRLDISKRKSDHDGSQKM